MLKVAFVIVVVIFVIVFNLVGINFVMKLPHRIYTFFLVAPSLQVKGAFALGKKL